MFLSSGYKTLKSIVSKSSGGAGGADTSRKEKHEIVYEVSKPGYIFYNKDNNLITMKTRIGNKRQELQMNYQSLVNKLDVQLEEKKQFEKERKQFIDLLDRKSTRLNSSHIPLSRMPSSA